jgi:hypothetical protein
MPIIKARSSSIIPSVDLRGTPTAPTASTGTHTTQVATTDFVSTAVTNLINGAPSILDTLSELANAINNDQSFSVTLTNLIGTKVALAGDTMTGTLVLSGDPVHNLDAVTKQYVDNNINAQMIYSTDDVPEGSTNKYYLDSRARSAISLSSDNTTVLDYNTSTGVLTYNHPTSDGILEGSTNKYYTDSRARSAISLTTDNNSILSYGSITGAFTWTTPNTDAIMEGSSNQYFTTARARASVSNGSNIDYDSTTGIISTQAAVWSVNGQTHDVSLDTDNINEGSMNLYFLNSRARAAVSLTTDDSNILSYNTASGTFTWTTPNTDAIMEGGANLYYTDTRVRSAVSASGDISYNQSTGNFSYSTPTTDGVTEGSTNKYFLNSRARSAISLTSSNTDILSYDSTTGTFTFALGNQTTDEVQEGQYNLYFTNARARSAVSLSSNWSNVSYNSTSGQFTVTAPTTDNVSEGMSNLYFLNQRVYDSLSVTQPSGDGSLTFDNSTGTFTYTGPSASEIRSHFSGVHSSGDGNFQYDSSTGAFTYFGPTNTNYRNAVSASHISGDGDFSYASSTGLFTYTGPTNANYRQAVSANKVSGDGNLAYDSTTGVFTYTGPSDSEVRAHFSVTKVSGDGNLTYSNSTGVFTYTGPSDSEVRAHFTADATTGITYDNTTGNFALASIPNSSLVNDNITILGATVHLGDSITFSTDDVGEGMMNLYYTNARARASISVSDSTGVLSYDNTTGVISVDASTLVVSVNGHKGIVVLNTDDIAEGPSASKTTSGLYYTTARTRSDVSGGTGVTYTQSTGVFEIGQAVETTSNVTFNDVIVSGDLTVNGTMTAVNSTTVTIADKNIELAKGSSNAAQADGAGLTVDGANATLTYAAGDDSWNLNRATNITGGLTVTSGNITGTFSGNITGNVTGDVTAANVSLSSLTTGRVVIVGASGALIDDSNLTFSAGTLTANDLVANGSVTASSVTASGLTQGRITFAGPGGLLSDNAGLTFANGVLTSTGGFSGNVTGNVTGNLTGNVTGQVSDLSNHTSDDVTEGTTNFYFTVSRVRSNISATSSGDGNLTYNSTTGVIAYTGPTALQQRAHFSGVHASGDGNFTYDNQTGAFTYTGPTFVDYRLALTAGKDTGDGNLSYDDVTGAFTYTGPNNTNYRAAVSANKVSGDGNFTYDSSTGVFSYTGPNDSEVRAHFTADATTGITYDNTTGAFALDMIPNSSLVNTTITINGTSVTLGSSNTFTTDAVNEGSTNKYYLDSRARNAISLTSSNTDILSYDTTTGEFVFDLTHENTDEIAEGTTNLYFTTTRARDSINVSGDLSYTASTGTISYSTPTTDGVNEGSRNLYFTDSRARQSISLTTDNTDALSYDNTTGNFHFTLASVDTDEIAEGMTNLYFTTSRARNTVSGGSNISYDPTTGIISTHAAVDSVNGKTNVVVLKTDDIEEGATNLYYLDSRARASIELLSDNTDILNYNNGTGTLSWTTPTTDAIAEGATHLYYTDARVLDKINVTSINELVDVDLTSGLSDGYTLVWSSAAQNFVPQNIATSSQNLNFTGDGTTTSYSTGVNVASIDNTQVYINGLIQAPTYSYTLSTTSNVSSIVFDTAPESNDYIMIKVISTSSLTAGGVLNEQSGIDGGTY